MSLPIFREMLHDETAFEDDAEIPIEHLLIFAVTAIGLPLVFCRSLVPYVLLAWLAITVGFIAGDGL